MKDKFNDNMHLYTIYFVLFYLNKSFNHVKNFWGIQDELN